MTRRRSGAGLLLALVVALMSVVAAQPAAAASGTYLRLAHLSPDTPSVDVVLTAFDGGNSVLNAVGYGDVSTYMRIEPGSYTVQMRPAGQPGAVPIVSGTFEAEDGLAYTAAALGPRADIGVVVLDDDLTPPAEGEARVRVVQGAEQAGDAVIRWNGTETETGVTFGGATVYVPVEAGAGSFEVVPAAGEPTTLPVTLASGGVYSVFVVERDGVLRGQVQTDALGPALTPDGGIDTGYGGTAGPSSGTVAAVLALLFAGFVGLRRVRRRSGV